MSAAAAPLVTDADALKAANMRSTASGTSGKMGVDSPSL